MEIMEWKTVKVFSRYVEILWSTRKSSTQGPYRLDLIVTQCSWISEKAKNFHRKPLFSNLNKLCMIGYGIQGFIVAQ